MSSDKFVVVLLVFSLIHFSLEENTTAKVDKSNPSLRLSCTLVECRDISDRTYDVVILIAAKLQSAGRLVPDLRTVLKHRFEIDNSTFSVKGVALIGVDKKILPSGRLILSTTGPLDRDFDDVRHYKDAAFRAVNMAKSKKFSRILLIVDNASKYENAKLVAVLAAMQPLYVPLQVREFELSNNRSHPETTLGVWFSKSAESSKVASFLAHVSAVESGKYIARDIITGDPERLTPPRLADYVKSQFSDSSITVEVISDQARIEATYPLVAAVNRAASNISRHHARIVKLDYTPNSSTINKTLLFVGKGVTLDTGGLDLKLNGHMIGMSTDKSGAAIVTGFFKTLDVLRPKHLRARAILALVRNSIGSNAFSCDELLVSRSGRRLRVTNTDSEGRLILADPLFELTQLARGRSLPDPHIFTVATLTGHASITVGRGYSIAIDNGPAKAIDFSRRLLLSSETTGEVIENSNLRREDYEYHKYADMEYEDLKQSNIGPSTQTSRGHMLPVAFMIMTSGLDKHGLNSKWPLKYTHLDIAGAEPSFPSVPWASPLISLVNHLVTPLSGEET